MTEPRNSESDDGVAFSRRDVLRTVGSAGTIGALGAEPATAKRSNRLIVGTEPGRADVARARAAQVAKTLDFDDVGQAVVGRWPERALRGLKRNPHVRYVEEDREGEYLGQDLPWGVDRIDAEVAHASGNTGSGVHVAVIDSGVDNDHPDLAPNLGTGFAPVDPCTVCPEEWDDEVGHGTQVAGIVGAVDNARDVVGVAPAVTLHAIKVGAIAPSVSGVAEGLVLAANRGYDVANMSLSLFESRSVEDAIAHAVANGVVLVASAGNNGARFVCDDDDCVSFPASDPRVIAVSNVGIDDTLRFTSSVGPEIDVAAPGVDVASTTPGGGTGPFGGTSAAAPHVAGAAAQLLAAGGAASDVRAELKRTAEDIGLADFEQGAGLLDLAAALALNSANDLLEVETAAADDVGFVEATLNGEVTLLTGNEGARVAFEWGERGDGLPNTTAAGTLSAAGPFDATLPDLEEDTDYEYRAVATVTDPDTGAVSTERGGTETFSTRDNLPPTVSFAVRPPEPTAGEPFTLDASGASDPDDSIVSYEWDLDGDGAFDDASGRVVTHTYPAGGDRTVGLRVTDQFGQTTVGTRTVRVNVRPTARFAVATDPAVRGDPVSFDATGSSDPDGSIASYEWDFEGDGTFVAAGPSPTHTYATGGDRTVTLRVTDDDGAVDETSVSFHVSIRVDVDIRPSGDGTSGKGGQDPGKGNGSPGKSSRDPGKSDRSRGKGSWHSRKAPVNLRSRHVPVAVRHTSAFDTARIDPSTLRFGDPATVDGGAGATLSHPGGHVEDVDGDGDADHLGHYPTGDTGFTASSTVGKLVGETTDGVSIFGDDDVRIVGGRP